MNILFLNKFNERWKARFRELKAEFPKVDFTASYNPDQRPDLIKTADAIISGRLSEDEIKSAQNLKVIFIPFTGLNTFPLDLIKEKNIILSNTHDNSAYVAERAVTLALALMGRVAEFHNDLKAGKWNRSIEDNEMWATLQNKNVGILGYGNIGRNIARLLKSFNCRVIGFKKNITNQCDDYAEEISSDLMDVIEKSTVIFVSLPLNMETKNIINDEILAKMQGKYVINVGRGETISEPGLYNALKDGILKGAALDVWYKYPGKNPEPVWPAELPFWELPNVLLSPHKSSHTIEAINAMIDGTCENIRSYILRGKPKEIVNL